MNTLAIGSKGLEVTQLQRFLAKISPLFVDGDFGENTERALMAYQRSAGLVADGVAGEKTLARIFGSLDPKHLSQADLQAAANELGVDLPAVMAVNHVESRGTGFLPNGKPVILFERHIMYRRLAASDKPELAENVDVFAARNPAVISKRPGGYAGGAAEHQRLAAAKQIDIYCAIESASWGLFQIMAFHWRDLGYESAVDFEICMRRSERDQLMAFVRLIKFDSRLHSALRKHQWAAFAKVFNGPNYKRNNYDRRLAAAFAKFTASEAGQFKSTVSEAA